MITPRSAFDVVRTVSLLILAVNLGAYVLSRVARARRARHAARHLVGRTYWSPDMTVTSVDPHLAAWLRPPSVLLLAVTVASLAYAAAGGCP
jgi:hypothetical protein